jgi:vacuolar-type H+-ATPase subunit I/STV1
MKKEEFKQKTRDVLDELTAYITQLEDKSGEITDDAREAYQKQLEHLKGIRDNLSAKLDEYENIADGKWDVVKESAGNFFASVAESWKENLGKVTDAFKKDEKKDEK